MVAADGLIVRPIMVIWSATADIKKFAIMKLVTRLAIRIKIPAQKRGIFYLRDRGGFCL